MEQAKQYTNSEKLEALNVKLGTLAQGAGFLQYNIDTYQMQLADKNVLIKNTILDLNKVQDAIAEEKAAADIEASKAAKVEEDYKAVVEADHVVG